MPPNSIGSSGKKKQKKRAAEEEEDEDERNKRVLVDVEDDDDDDDIDAADPNVDGENTLELDSKKKRKKKDIFISAATRTPHKQKGVNDALNDFKASFGVTTAVERQTQQDKKVVSSKISSSSSSSATVKGRSTPSLLNRLAAFKNSFGEQASSSTSSAASGSTPRHTSNASASTSGGASSSRNKTTSTSTVAATKPLPISASTSSSSTTILQQQRTPVKSAIRSHPGSSFLDSISRDKDSSGSSKRKNGAGKIDTSFADRRVYGLDASESTGLADRSRDKGKGRAVVTVEDAESEFEVGEDAENGGDDDLEISQEDETAADHNSPRILNDDVNLNKQDTARTAQVSAASKKRATSITSLSDLSARKHFKILNASTPSRPSPLRYDTPSNNVDIKPFKTLGAISGLNVVSDHITLAGLSAAAESRTDAEGGDLQQRREGTTLSEHKPRWAQLLEGSTTANTGPINAVNTSGGGRTTTAAAALTTTAQDLTELLSPRKKRKGWVPAGHAEMAAATIKRLQTGSNLWIHEISRTLTTFSKHGHHTKGVKNEDGSSTTTTITATASSKNAANTTGKSYDDLLRDLNPHLRLQILEIHSSKPASLTWTSSEGGFITAGAAEKLLITRCKILKDEEAEQGLNLTDRAVNGERGSSLSSRNAPSQPTLALTGTETASATPKHTPNGGDLETWSEDQVEGLVVFSLAGHSRTSTGVTLARKEQRRPARAEADNDDGGSTDPHNGPSERDRQAHANPNQPLLSFEKANDKDSKRSCTVFVPASISDLHTQMRVEDEIWVWEPWSPVDLAAQGSNGVSALLAMSVSAAMDAEGTSQQGQHPSEKALLVSRFGIVL